ncbi:helix-turn-helix domain-containing protein [Bifidobacterium cuniculi]|uniref:helix-turn-helix domain-containing protein n=2 Tax=Bifidobacterium cuniculi TaxID=1688 RepID=UPI0009DDF159|nr:helix-turn-helix transcriptional regulator [Bifidobacterium cuniculi]
MSTVTLERSDLVQNEVDLTEAVIAWNIRMQLTAQGLTQKTLAEGMGLRQPTLTNKLNGRIAWSIADLVRAAACLNTSPEKLLDPNLMQQLGVNTELTKNPRRHAVGNDGELLRLGLNQRPSD